VTFIRGLTICPTNFFYCLCLKHYLWWFLEVTVLFERKIWLYMKVLSFLSPFHISKHIGLKNRHKKLKCHTVKGGGGPLGGQKSAKKCHILFEWPQSTKDWNRYKLLIILTVISARNLLYTERFTDLGTLNGGIFNTVPAAS